ncbi:MAG: hypothetical protein JXA81_11610 [Sedimentisphaerales bacterium]|nr:hypothetical protein [Sedimentisphaerales bacterium]
MEKGLILEGFLFLLALCFHANAAETEQKLLGDESDGSRAHPIHRLELFAEPGEEGKEAIKIDPNIDTAEEVLLPFSTRLTCGECHSYGIIKGGWHFNSVDPNVDPGRPAQPWIYVDARTGTQIPLSYRSWPGTFKPEQFGLSDREFTKIFGRQMPGGGPGETDDPDEVMRQYVSGKLEINCLACHNGDPRQDQGGTTGYAVQVSRGNFRWAAAASSGLATVTGSANDMDEMYDPFDPFSVETAQSGTKKPPTITYHKNVFDYDNTVFFDILREVPSHRCYFCHSNLYIGSEETEKWSEDEDIHLKSGLTCVDCHRNGMDHNIIRGYEGEEDESDNELAAVSSCESCHLGEHSASEPTAGRLSAPVPEHFGIPPVHFEKLTCTACHSGPWPDDETHLTKTSRAHRLGTPNVNKAREMLPHIASPVFAKQADGKIAPHKLVWPAFWGILKDDSVMPIELGTVTKVIEDVLSKEEFPFSGDWPDLTDDHIAKGLTALASGASAEDKTVYVAGGRLYSLDDSGQLSEQKGHPAAKPYLWPIGHDVRPAAQALGIRYCTDCHGTKAPFFFGSVNVDTPVVAARESKKMIEFEDVSPFYTWAFAFSFVFRPWMKMVIIGSCALMSLVLLLYALKALGCVIKTLAGEN